MAGFVVGLACSLSVAAENATTFKETQLKTEPFTDAVTLATLPEQTAVEVIKRQGGWTQVKPAATAQGWVRMLSLRFANSSTKPGDSGLGSLFNVMRTGSSGTTVITGVKGLDITSNSLQNASPNNSELQRMHSYGASKVEALQLAGSANLQNQSLQYLGDK
jgi:hypothetical protein